MKLNTKQISNFLKQPDPKIRAVLVYGEDRGLIDDRVKMIAEAVVGDLNDPFRVGLLTGAQIVKDPACLTDEASALSMIGGDRVVIIESDGSDFSKTLQTLLKTSANNSLLIIKAGELKPSSPIRKLIERNNLTATLPTYKENETSLKNLINSILRDHGVTTDQKTIHYLINNLGSDRRVTRSELEKLVIYLGKEKKLELQDALAVVGDNASLSIDQVVYAAANGNSASLERKLQQAFNEGQAPVRILRAAIAHFKRLYSTSILIHTGKTLTEALNSIKPPIIFFLKNEFTNQLRIWNEKKLEKALILLFRAELECKKTGFPDKAICGRALISLARTGRQGH